MNKWQKPNPNPNMREGQLGEFVSSLETIQKLLQAQLDAEISNLNKSELELKKYQAQMNTRKKEDSNG
jgi:hypothetical protein